jgi:hypothetical protein
MKKVLILAYDFPPFVSVGGLRPFSWYEHFKDYDLHPVIVTRQWFVKYGNNLDYIAPGTSNKVELEESEFGTLIRAPYKPNLANRLMLKYGENRFVLMRRFITAWYEFMQFIFLIGTKSSLYYAARNYLKQNKVDAIIATGDPFILFRYAHLLSKQFGVPWIADYRDPWVQDKTRSNYNILKYWDAFFERKYLASARIITAVSTFVIKQIEKNIYKKPFGVIPNGYSDEALNISRKSKQGTGIFTISYAGTIYKWHPWQLCFKSLNDLLLKRDGPEIRINFYGVSIESEIRSYIKEKYPRLQSFIHFHSRKPNNELLLELAKANAFLLFNDYSILGTKIYDYLVLRRKIILCFSHDKEAASLRNKHYHVDELDSESTHLQQDVIEQTNSGIIVENVNHLNLVLENLLNEFQENGVISCKSIGIEKFSRKIQTEKLAALIKEL